MAMAPQAEKPEAVKEGEEGAGTSVEEAWAKLKGSHPNPSDEDFELFIEASRRERGRWELKQSKLVFGSRTMRSIWTVIRQRLRFRLITARTVKGVRGVVYTASAVGPETVAATPVASLLGISRGDSLCERR